MNHETHAKVRIIRPLILAEYETVKRAAVAEVERLTGRTHDDDAHPFPAFGGDEPAREGDDWRLADGKTFVLPKGAGEYLIGIGAAQVEPWDRPVS